MLLAYIQVLDGLITYFATITHGIHIEGNILLRDLMLIIGIANTLIVVKILAIISILLVIKFEHRVSWVNYALHVLIIIYVFTAIMPWSLYLMII